MARGHATNTLDGATARDLVRVSHDKSGREKSPDDQHRDHQATAKANGWKLVGPSYRDLVSASEFGPEHREDFERLIADLENDQFSAQILMMWENSRGSRREGEWIKLIDLAKLRNVVFWIEVRGRIMDPKNPHDRRDLVHAAADAAFESGLLSDRSCRGIRNAATDGLPHGRIPYGYSRVYDGRTGDFVEQVPDETEAPVVRELFERVARGESLRSITESFKERGIEKRSGGPFTSSHLRTLLINPTYAGIRIHDPDRKRGRPKLGPRARQIPAVWPALVKPAQFRKVQRLLADPKRRTSKGGGAKHLLSMIVRCDVCGSVVRSAPCATSGELRYACHSARGCARIPQAELDKFVVDLTLAWLSDPDRYGVLMQSDDARADELAELDRQLLQVTAERDELAARVAAGEEGFTVAFVAPMAAGFEKRIKAIEARQRQLQSSALDGLLEPGPDVAKRWAALTAAGRIDVQRLVMRRLLVPEYVGEVRIKPVGRGRRKVPVELVDRVVIVQG
jgi:DNA invertase Pin-like site-specific DNA recombinase